MTHPKNRPHRCPNGRGFLPYSSPPTPHGNICVDEGHHRCRPNEVVYILPPSLLIDSDPAPDGNESTRPEKSCEAHKTCPSESIYTNTNTHHRIPRKPLAPVPSSHDTTCSPTERVTSPYLEAQPPTPLSYHPYAFSLHQNNLRYFRFIRRRGCPGHGDSMFSRMITRPLGLARKLSVMSNTSSMN